MTNWIYAEYSHNAKLAGGPEQYVSKIWTEGFRKGRMRGFFLGAGSLGGTALGVYGVYSLLKGYVIRRRSKAEAVEAKCKLIEGIRTYDEQKARTDTKDRQMGFYLR